MACSLLLVVHRAGIPSLLGPPLRHSEMVSDEQQQMDPDCFLPALVLAPPPAITARTSTGVSALQPRENMRTFDHSYNFLCDFCLFCMLSTIKIMTLVPILCDRSGKNVSNKFGKS